MQNMTFIDSLYLNSTRINFINTQNMTFIDSLYLNSTWINFINVHLTYSLELIDYLQLFMYICLYLSFVLSYVNCTKIVGKIVFGVMVYDTDINDLDNSSVINLILQVEYLLFHFIITKGIIIICVFNLITIISTRMYKLI